MLLPRADNRQLTTVGGPGKEFWVFGTNYANDVAPETLRRSSLEPGAWRIELSPKAAAEEDLLLTVMQFTDHANPSRLPVRLWETPDRVGAFVERPEGNRLVLFRRDGARAARRVTIELPAPGPTSVLVTDLAPGTWCLQCAGRIGHARNPRHRKPRRGVV